MSHREGPSIELIDVHKSYEEGERTHEVLTGASVTIPAGQRVAVLGAPNASGQRRAGVERAPAILRAAGILDDIRSLGWDVDDLGDAHAPKLPVPSPPHGPRKTNAWGDADAAALHSAVADRVHDALASGAVPLILGGDHSVSIGSVASDYIRR